MVIKITIFGKIYLEERLPDIGKGADTCMQKHPYKIQYHVCNIYCVSETTPFIWPAEKRFEFAMMVKQIILGELCPHLQESSDIWLKRTTPFTSRLMSHAVNRKRKKKKVLCVHWLVSSAQAVTTVSHSMFLFLHFGTSLHRLSWMWVLKLAALLAKLPFWLDIVWTLTQRREFCDHLTSLINKSSLAK